MPVVGEVAARAAAVARVGLVEAGNVTRCGNLFGRAPEHVPVLVEDGLVLVGCRVELAVAIQDGALGDVKNLCPLGGHRARRAPFDARARGSLPRGSVALRVRATSAGGDSHPRVAQ